MLAYQVSTCSNIDCLSDCLWFPRAKGSIFHAWLFFVIFSKVDCSSKPLNAIALPPCLSVFQSCLPKHTPAWYCPAQVDSSTLLFLNEHINYTCCCLTSKESRALRAHWAHCTHSLCLLLVSCYREIGVLKVSVSLCYYNKKLVMQHSGPDVEAKVATFLREYVAISLQFRNSTEKTTLCKTGVWQWSYVAFLSDLQIDVSWRSYVFKFWISTICEQKKPNQAFSMLPPSCCLPWQAVYHLWKD